MHKDIINGRHASKFGLTYGASQIAFISYIFADAVEREIACA